MAAEICNEALKLVLDKCVEGAKCGDLCDAGDRFIVDKTRKVTNIASRDIVKLRQ